MQRRRLHLQRRGKRHQTMDGRAVLVGFSHIRKFPGKRASLFPRVGDIECIRIDVSRTVVPQQWQNQLHRQSAF